MTTTLPAQDRAAARAPLGPLVALAVLEGRRMLRHPAPWVGLALSLWWAVAVTDEPWSGAAYPGYLTSTAPLLLGVSIASVSAFGRELVPVAEGAVTGPARRTVARMLGGLGPVGLVTAVTAGGALFLRLDGGVSLGDEPGRTAHAHYSVPELLQPVLLAGLAVVVGGLAVRVLRNRLAASIVLVVGWFLVSTYWLFSGPVARLLTPLQAQPDHVEVGPAHADPTTFPASWLLSGPGEHQDHWARVVVSPPLAAWHDVYLVGLVLLVAGCLLPRGARSSLLAGALVLGALGLAMKAVVAP